MRAFLYVMRNTLLTEIEYRINYVLLVFSGLITLVMELAVLRHVFSDQEQVGTLSKDSLLSFVVLGAIVRSGSSVWSLMHEVIDEIREGTFRRYLYQPIHFPSYFFARITGGKLFTWFLSIVILYSCTRFESFNALLPAPAVLPFIVAIVLSYFLVWQVYLTMAYLGFWIEEAGFLSMAFNLGVGTFAGSVIPLDWLPPLLQTFMRYTPFPIFGDFPMRAGLNTLSTHEFNTYVVQSLLWILAFFAVNALLWRAGTKRYEAYGG